MIRVKHIEAMIKTKEASEGEAVRLLRTIDLSKNILDQVADNTTIDAINEIILRAGQSRSKNYKDIINKAIEYPCSDSDFLMILKTDYKELLVEEKKFLRAYDDIFEQTFFNDDITAHDSYMITLSGGKLLLKIEIKDFREVLTR